MDILFLLLLIILDSITSFFYFEAQLKKCKRKKREVQMIFTSFINGYQIQILKVFIMQLTKKAFTDANLALKDSDTGNPIEATFGDLQMSSSDTGIFTADSDVDGDGTIDIVGVGVGSADLTVSASVSYQDPKNGQQVNITKTTVITVTVEAGEGANTEMVVTLSDPKPVPDAANTSNGDANASTEKV